MVVVGGYAFFQWIDFLDFVAQPVQGALGDNFERHLDPSILRLKPESKAEKDTGLRRCDEI
jgi:hypothetical protein